MEQYALYCWLKQKIESIDVSSFFSQISYNYINKILMGDTEETKYEQQNQVGIYIHGGNGPMRRLQTNEFIGYEDRVQVLFICNSANNNDLQMQKIGMKLKKYLDTIFNFDEQIEVVDGGVYKLNGDVDLIEFDKDTNVKDLEAASITITTITCGGLNYIGVTEQNQVMYDLNLSIIYNIH